MQLIINDRNLLTMEKVRQFLGGSEAPEFRALSVVEKYNWIEEVLKGSHLNRRVTKQLGFKYKDGSC